MSLRASSERSLLYLAPRPPGSLLYLAPDLQEALLFLPPTPRGRDPIILADLLSIAATLDWRKQRRLWRQRQPT